VTAALQSANIQMLLIQQMFLLACPADSRRNQPTDGCSQAHTAIGAGISPLSSELTHQDSGGGRWNDILAHVRSGATKLTLTSIDFEPKLIPSLKFPSWLASITTSNMAQIVDVRQQHLHRMRRGRIRRGRRHASLVVPADRIGQWSLCVQTCATSSVHYASSHSWPAISTNAATPATQRQAVERARPWRQKLSTSMCSVTAGRVARSNWLTVTGRR
jgi:hypothetical protein